MEECSGASGMFGAIDWYLVPAEDLEHHQDGAVGLMVTERYENGAVTRTGYIPSGYIWHKGIVTHEMLHALGFSEFESPPFGICAPMWAKVE